MNHRNVLLFAPALAACLGQPARPHGDGPPIAAGSTLSHHNTVADLNDDGYDDLILWGSEVGTDDHPLIFVYFGGDPLENPDLRLDLHVPIDGVTAPDHQFGFVQAVSFFASGDTRGLATLSQECLGTTVDTCTSQHELGGLVTATGRTLGPWQHTDPALQRPYARDGDRAWATLRDTVTSYPARELLIGEAFQGFSWIAPPSPTADSTSYGFEIPEPGDYVSDLITLPGATGGGQDLLVIASGAVYRTIGDRTTPGVDLQDTTFKVGPRVPYPDASTGNRHTHARADAGHLLAVIDSQFTADLQLVDLPPTGDPLTYSIGAAVPADDFVIANLGGGPQLDLAAISSSNLGVYQDLTLAATGLSPPADILGTRDDLSGYDQVAVGNFFGDVQLELYVISSTHPDYPPRCYHLGATLAPC